MGFKVFTVVCIALILFIMGIMVWITIQATGWVKIAPIVTIVFGACCMGFIIGTVISEGWD